MRNYRGKRKDGVWVYGYYVKWQNRHYIAPEPHESGFSGGKIVSYEIAGFHQVIPETIGQSTGIKDKNGKDLDWWEGDICAAEYICPVCFDNKPHLLTGTIEQDNNGLWIFEYEHGSLPLDCEDLEIIEKVGDIHTTPELLGETK